MKVDKAPQKKKKANHEGNNRNKIIAACIAASLFIALIVVVAFDILYVAPAITVDGESYNVNDIEVRYNVYNAEAQVQMDAAYAYTMGAYSNVGEYWNLDGVKDNAKDIAKNASTRYLLMYKEAVKNGMTLTEEEKEDVKKKATEFYNAMSDSHKKRAKYTLDEYIEYAELMKLANKYIDQLKESYKVTNETLETPVDKKDYDEIKFKVIVAPITDAQSTDEEPTKFDDKTLATYKAKMEEYLKQAKEGKDFSELVAEEDSMIYQYMETTINRDEETYQTLIDALEPLEEGELGEYVVEDDKAYYIVEMVDKNSTESYELAVETAITTRQEELLNADLNKLLDEYNVKIGSGWDDINMGTVVVHPGDNIDEFLIDIMADEDEDAAEDENADTDASASPEETQSTDEQE